MKNMIRKIAIAFCMLFVVGCAGLNKSCASCTAENFASDWVVVQLDLSGKPFRCWALQNVSISNEGQSDGIWWENQQGNLVHISGLYNRVQVRNDNWNDAYSELALTKETCEKIHSTKVSIPE